MHLNQSVIPPVSSDKQRQKILRYNLADESKLVRELIECAAITDQQREATSSMAAKLVSKVRASGNPSMMENFLAEYGLTTREGVALMCLAEALLRVPDAKTIDELMKRTKEAILLCLEDQKDNDFKTKFIGLQKIEV